MPPSSPPEDLLSRQVDPESPTADDLVLLRHKVFNDSQTVIACIVQEVGRSAIPEVKEALWRVAECVHQLASSLRQSEAN